MNWVAISVGIADDARIGAMAQVLNRDVAHVVGLVVCVLAHFPKHARDGSIAPIPAETIERWANWRGRRGVFDAAFRSHMCTADGIVRAWEKYNGGAIRRADADAERKRAYRQKGTARPQDDPQDSPQDGAQDSPQNVRNLSARPSGRDVTGRDKTRQTAKTTDTNAEGKPSLGLTAGQRPGGAPAVSQESRGTAGKPTRLTAADIAPITGAAKP